MGERVVSVLLTFHALERVERWRLTERQVLGPLLPEEVLRGHRDRFIAHRRKGTRVVRVVYEYDQRLPAVLTVYCPAAKRYIVGEVTMKIAYSPDADILTIRLREGRPADSRDLAEGVIVHLSAKGQPLEIKILDASKVVQKKDVEVSMAAVCERAVSAGDERSRVGFRATVS